MRYQLLFLLFAISLFAHGQMPSDRPAELPAGLVNIDAKYPDDPENRLLTAFYGSISYPRIARENGIVGGVIIVLSIDTLGQVTVEEVEFRSPDTLSARPVRIPEGDVLRVIGYQIPAGNIRPPTKNTKRRIKAETALVAEVERTFTQLPLFSPAIQDGRPVPSAMVKLVLFSLE